MLRRPVFLIKGLLYLLAAAACAVAFRHQRRSKNVGGLAAYADTLVSCGRAILERRLAAPPRAWQAFGWLVCALACAAMAALILANVDALTKERAIAVVWYERRRPIQVTLTIGAVAAALVVLTAIVSAARRSPRLALALAATLVGWLVLGLRLISYSSVDRVLGRPVLGVTLNAIAEGLAIIVVLVSAVREQRAAQR